MPASSSLLLRAAAEELQRQGGAVNGPIRVEAIGPDRTHIMVESVVAPSELLARTTELPPMPSNQNGTPSPPPRRGKEFSPLEEAIMKVVTEEWQTRAEIAAACGMSVSSSFSTILSNLVDREYLESGHRGFRKPPL